MDTKARTWRALGGAYARVAAEIDRDLQRSSGLSLKEHQMLVELDAAEAGFLRLNELAERLDLSPSGLSRLADRLEYVGLVERVTCPSDRRGFHAQTTELGKERLRIAQEMHAAALERAFGELPDDILEQVAKTLERVDQGA